MRSLLLIVLLFVMGQINAQIFSDTIRNISGATTNLSGSYTVPQGIYTIKVQCWGGGGSGGAATGQAAAAGGGSGGGYVEKDFIVTPGQVFNYSVGNGGNGLTTSTNRNGGSTWFGSNTTLLAVGGLGGSSATLDFNTAQGANAVITGNIGETVSYYGGAGGTGSYGGNGTQSGGGGGSAGTVSNGNPGYAATGGSSVIGGGAGASAGTWQLPLNCNCNGNAGDTPGGGGSGAQSSDPADNHGGHGGTGMIVVSAIRPGVGGSVYKDLNANCVNDNETGLPQFKVQVMPGNYITETDSQGFWVINDIPLGTYSVIIDTNKSPMVICQPVSSVNVLQLNQFYSAGEIGVYNTNCPILDVSVYAPILRRCFQNQKVYVSACNNLPSTISLNSSYVDVGLNQLMTVTNATLPYTSLGNNIYRFQTGNINPGQCVGFNISTTISCSAMNGQTLCMSANLYPVESCVLDTIPSDPVSTGGIPTSGGTLDGLPQPCNLPWDQSSLTVDGWCQNDSVYFYVENHGSGDMDCYSPVMVYVDGVLTYTDSILLVSGQGVTYVYPGDGQTWILNAEQHPLHPGNSHPNAHVEACGDTTNWTSDLVNDFPLDDADPVVDIYCGVVTGSYDPNDKTGFPTGQTAQHYIQPNQQLQYVIRFQNTGTDTAFTVVIRDTLDTDLNIFTVTPGVSSHNYEFRMYGPRVLEWTFNNILLPDSTTNDPESNGFVTFHLEQVPDLAPGTEITNDADIYFDFNDPITTNTTMHRIFEGFVSVASLEEMVKKHSTLTVYPNPTSGSVTIKPSEEWNNEKYEVYDQSGRKLLMGVMSGSQNTIQLPFGNGMYYLKIRSEVVKVQVMK